MNETILTDALNQKILLIFLGVGIFLLLVLILEKVLAPHLKLSKKMSLYGIIFISLPFLYFVVVLIIPMLRAFQFSFMDYNLFNPEKKFIGFENYAYMLKSELFWKSLANAFKFALFRVPVVVVLSLVTALCFQKIKKFQNLLRTLMLLPFMTSGVALGWIFNFMYSRQGPVFAFLKLFNLLDVKALLTLNVNTALYAIAAVSAWASIGYYALLFMVGLDSIPNEVYDAAKVDGANGWQIFWKVTWPLLNPTLVLISILAVTASLKNFDLIRVMSGNNGTGGPMNSTLTMPLLIYMEAFTRLNMGRAAAITVVFFIIIMVITLVQLKVTQRDVYY